MIELTAFQRDIVRILYHQDQMIGLDIKDTLQEERGENVNHGRLYPNLDTLADKGYIDKSSRDKRSNFYGLTEEGGERFEEYIETVSLGA